ncbi:MAG TPA: hypothetical protein VFL59_11995 [Candidatus Nanopelagicales bacterium]|nr:hypothetical protein [Candidatus Nanopelagicales bacterium]
MDADADDTATADDVPRWNDPARAVQMLSTEHWGLLSARGLSWQETFSRSGLFLTVLSAGVVALALVGQATDFDSRFTGFAAVLLVVVYLVGAASVVRLAHSAVEEVHWIAGMNRIRHAYVELEPSLADYLVTSTHDDVHGILASMGAHRDVGLFGPRLAVTTAGMVGVVNSVVAAAGVGLVVAGLGGRTLLAVVLGVVAFAVSTAALLGITSRAYARAQRDLRPRFPSGPST